MKLHQLKLIVGMLAITVIGLAYFVWGCNQGSLYPLIGAILILAGKEIGEYMIVRNGGQ